MYGEVALSLEKKQSKDMRDWGISICGEQGNIAGEGVGNSASGV